MSSFCSNQLKSWTAKQKSESSPILVDLVYTAVSPDHDQ